MRKELLAKKSGKLDAFSRDFRLRNCLLLWVKQPRSPPYMDIAYLKRHVYEYTRRHSLLQCLDNSFIEFSGFKVAKNRAQ